MLHIQTQIQESIVTSVEEYIINSNSDDASSRKRLCHRHFSRIYEVGSNYSCKKVNIIGFSKFICLSLIVS